MKNAVLRIIPAVFIAAALLSGCAAKNDSAGDTDRHPTDVTTSGNANTRGANVTDEPRTDKTGDETSYKNSETTTTPKETATTKPKRTTATTPKETATTKPKRTTTPKTTAPEPKETAATPPQTADDIIAELFANKQSDVQVHGNGVVTRLLADDTDGDRHQRFILELAGGQTLLIAHNTDIAPRLDGLAVGDTVEFYGEYYYNEQGGGVHWTHRDPDGGHVGGYLKWNGKTFD